MKIDLTIKLKALFLLFIITVSSIGLPLVKHECNHEKIIELNVFSSSESDCCSAISCCEIKKTKQTALGFNESPCCTFETNIISNDQLVHNTNNINQINIFSFVSSIKQETSFLKENKTISLKTNYSFLYGLEYRIAMQSFLC